MRLTAVALAFVIATAGTPARGGLRFEVAGGASIPAGSASSALNAGGTFGVGFGYAYSRFALLLDYSYAGNSIGHGALSTGDLEGLHSLHALALDGRAAVIDGSAFRLHVLLAPGLYYRKVSIDRVVGSTVASFCNPVLLFCAPQQVPLTDSLGSRERFDFGLAAGLRLGLAVARPVEPFLEVRVHRVFGPTVEDASGRARSTSETFIPIVLGVSY